MDPTWRMVVVLTSGDLTKATVAESLFRIGALKFGKFTLASGRTSSYYLDLRMIPSFPEVYSLAVSAYEDMAERIGASSFDIVAGVATAGITFSSPLAFLLKKPMVYVRKEEKTHGLGRAVEGALTAGKRVLVIDDLVTSGGSILSAVEPLRRAGGVVSDAAVLVDRLEGGKSNLASVGIRLNAFAEITELTEILRSNGRMTKEDFEAVAKQVGRRPA